MIYILASVLAIVVIASESTPNETCYVCDEHFIDSPMLGKILKDASTLCTEDTKISCPAGAKCSAFLIKASVVYSGAGKEYAVLRSTCSPVDSAKDVCQDGIDKLSKGGWEIVIESCEQDIDVQENRFFKENGKQEQAKCFDCMEYTDSIRGPLTEASIPCTEPITCEENDVCSQMLVEMVSLENPEQIIEMKLARCTPTMYTCEDLEVTNADHMRALNVSIGSCNDEANFFTDSVDDNHNEVPVK